MRVVVQRSKAASVTVLDEIVGSIDFGLVVLVAIAPNDGIKEVEWMAEKIAHLRIFADEQGKMNRSVIDEEGEILVISQFTLYGDCRKGRRPHFGGAARPEHAVPMYEYFCAQLRKIGISSVETGQFGAMMQVQLVNDGPVTLVIDSKG
ncbi:MAG: D-tyrosyl-tRNA(Tyr) deacylase [Deltaproteobacteria bacterium]|nr:D-tyrosyl-tRNA(Tyr) deacylase [Deltaproteobacteria bacterium]